MLKAAQRLLYPFPGWKKTPEVSYMPTDVHSHQEWSQAEGHRVAGA